MPNLPYHQKFEIRILFYNFTNEMKCKLTFSCFEFMKCLPIREKQSFWELRSWYQMIRYVCGFFITAFQRASYAVMNIIQPYFYLYTYFAHTSYFYQHSTLPQVIVQR